MFITIKEWVSNILWLLVSVRKDIQLLKLLPVLLLYYGVNNEWLSSTPKYLAGDIDVCRRRKESTKHLKKNWVHSCSSDGKIAWCTIWNPIFYMECGIYVGEMRGKSETLKKRCVDICCLEEVKWKEQWVKMIGKGFKFLWSGSCNICQLVN